MQKFLPVQAHLSLLQFLDQVLEQVALFVRDLYQNKGEGRLRVWGTVRGSGPRLTCPLIARMRSGKLTDILATLLAQGRATPSGWV